MKPELDEVVAGLGSSLIDTGLGLLTGLFEIGLANQLDTRLDTSVPRRKLRSVSA